MGERAGIPDSGPGLSVQTIPGTPPVQHTPWLRWQRPRLLIILLLILTFVTLAHLIAVVHSAYPTPITNTCSSLIRNTDYTKIVPIQSKTQTLDAIQYADDLTGGQPAALLQVTDSGPQHLLDVYLYGCTMQQKTPTLNLLLKQQGLVQGSATITNAHTLSIGQLDTTIPPDNSVLLQPLQQNVYSEYRWDHGSLTHVLFPGLYPVLNRSEAEELQDEANHGQNLPWNDPRTTTEQMAHDLFEWSNDTIQSKLLDANGTAAHVLLTQTRLHLTVTVTLQRLVQSDNKGLWFVTGAQTAHITLVQGSTFIASSSPMTIQGSIGLKQGK
ncbi:MAG TPA: hypothetical protein VKX46_21915, partial [Ktedonobacteraceae bacterium]|nr:hypothetical protein [Ktedonobacteraceae bacterium]